MKVLSLFDGMSCGQIALDRLGIKVDKYYASEIDKYAMQVTQANFPETIQVGDICKLDPKDFMDVDLILAGSPCQGFSFAGKQLAFDDPRSALFFEFIRLLKEIKPKYFLLENVKMKKEYLQIISEQVSACYPEIPFGIEPIFINSSLVSAQSRQRYYWTNIPNITQPKERGIVLRDILEEDPGENPVKDTARNQRHYKNLDEKSLCMTATMYKGAGNNGMTLVPQKIHDIPRDILKDNERQRRVYSKDGKSPTLLARPDSPKVMKSDKPEHIGTATGIKQKILEDNLDKMTTKDGKAYALTTTYGAAGAKDSLEKKRRSMIPTSDKPVDVRAMTEVRTPEANQIRYEHKRKTGKDWSPRHMRHLVERQDEKMNTLTSALTKQHILQITKDKDQEVYWRKLTPLECERLQTVPDNYTNHVSNTQRYKMLGNGWTIEVIAHIFKNMEVENDS